MLSNNLNTNEVRNAAGTEVEFQSYSQDKRERIFAKIGETPALPVRLSVKHQEVGVGFKNRRRSMVRVDITSISTVDSVTPVVSSFYVVGDIPVGALTTIAPAADALAMLLSFVGTNGTSTLLYDGTGTGASALLAGSI